METAPTNSERWPAPETQNHPEKGTIRYEILNDPEIRVEYLSLTDGLISRMAEQKTDVAIFLDKSARPVAWLVNELWDQLAPIDSGTGQKMQKPEVKFLNIDREQWGAILGRSEDKEGGIDIDRLPKDRLEELQKLYDPIVGTSSKGDKSLLTGKNVLVVDEVRMSGDTLSMSQLILDKAFPDAKSIESAYWMSGEVKESQKSTTRVGTKVPVWYSDQVSTGRLVGDRDVTKSNRSNSGRQRTGRYWLSAPFREPDQSGRQLKHEIEQLAQDLSDHKIVFKYSPLWNSRIESIENRIERINGISDDEYTMLRQVAKDDQEFNDLYVAFFEDKNKKFLNS